VIIFEYLRRFLPIIFATYFFSHSFDSKTCLRRFTDAKIFLDGEEFYAHKIIICSRSPILSDYYLGSPRTDDSGWSIFDNEDFVRIGRINRELFGIILEYMYTGKIANSVFKVRRTFRVNVKNSEKEKKKKKS
jgi:hypothetical protein